MVSQFKVTAKALVPFMGLLLLTLLPSSDGSNNIHSDISLKGSSSGSVANNVHVDVNVDAQSRVEVVGNVNSDLNVNGGSLKFFNNKKCHVTVKDCDLEVTNCANSDISGQNNKGTIRQFFNSDFTGNDNELDVVGCNNCFLQSDKMTIVASDSKHLRVQDSSHSKVKMLRVDNVQVSGRDFTLEGTDIQDHTFIGKGCSSGEKMTHYLTFLPSAKRPCLLTDINIGRNVFVASSINYGDFEIKGSEVSRKDTPTIIKSCKNTCPLSINFCNAAKVIGPTPTYEIGGLSRLTIEIEEEKVNIKVIDGNPECKLVSEEGKMKISISTSSEQLIIEGAKDIRRVEDGKCEFILSLGNDADPASDKTVPAKLEVSILDNSVFLSQVILDYAHSASGSDSVVASEEVTTAEDKDNNSMLDSLVSTANTALDLARSFVHKFIM